MGFPGSRWCSPKIHKTFFTAADWKSFENTKANYLNGIPHSLLRLWGSKLREALGTAITNDEVVNGVSERGAYPVVKKENHSGIHAQYQNMADRLLRA